MNVLEFKPFHETYKIISFTLGVGMIYPNPKTEKWRIAAIPLMVGSISPVGLMILLDMYRCWRENDIVNIIRHSTVLGPFLGGFFKMVLMYYKRNQSKQIIDEITRDHLSLNEYKVKYKEIARLSIRNAQVYSETCWLVVVLVCVMIFPAVAVLLNTYNFLFKTEPVKYMIHDVRFPNSEPEARFESPYFEFIFVYMMYCVVLYVIYYVSYDGFFGLAINHACLKINLYCAALEDAVRAHSTEVYWRVVCVIREQSKMYEFVDLIQDQFNIWLGIILVATMIQICTCLYHVTEGLGFDLRYMVFMVGAVVHIYLPCRYASKLKEMSVESADKIYCCGWENVQNKTVRKMIIMMIARAQIPTQITAFNMINFDMELFVSIMQSSYSMFTLMTS